MEGLEELAVMAPMEQALPEAQERDGERHVEPHPEGRRGEHKAARTQQFEREIETDQRLVEASEPGERAALVEPGFRRARIQDDGAVVAGEGFLVPAQGEQGMAALVPHIGERAAQSDGLIETGDGLLVPAERAEDGAAMEPRLIVARVERERAVETGQFLVAPSQPGKDARLARPGEIAVRVEFQAALEATQRLFRRAGVRQRVAPAQPGDGRMRVEFNRPIKARQRLASATKLIERVADKDEAIRQQVRAALARNARTVDFGPDVNASNAEARQARDRWRTWWELNPR